MSMVSHQILRRAHSVAIDEGFSVQLPILRRRIFSRLEIKSFPGLVCVHYACGDKGYTVQDYQSSRAEHAFWTTGGFSKICSDLVRHLKRFNGYCYVDIH